MEKETQTPFDLMSPEEASTFALNKSLEAISRVGSHAARINQLESLVENLTSIIENQAADIALLNEALTAILESLT